MAKGIREIKRQIKSVQNMKQITKAMEMVAASKLRKAQGLAESARPYAEKIKEVIASIASATRDSDVSHPMLVSREVRRTGYVVISSDSGLAGGYNANLLRKMMDIITERHASSDEYAILVLGRKGRDFFRNKGIEMLEAITELSDSPTFADIKELTAKAVGNFAEEKYDELYLVYNEFVNPMVQRPVERKLLPLEQVEEEDGQTTTEYIYEPSAEEVLNVLLPKYAETLIYSALLEAKASEFGARMTAMGNATRNATELISSLTLTYNRARQAAITQEITEIVAGANALE